MAIPPPADDEHGATGETMAQPPDDQPAPVRPPPTAPPPPEPTPDPDTKPTPEPPDPDTKPTPEPETEPTAEPDTEPTPEPENEPPAAREIDPRDVPTAEWIMPPEDVEEPADDVPDALPTDDVPDGHPTDASAAAEPAPPTTARPRRTARWVAAVVALALMVCGGGAVSAYLLVSRVVNGHNGAPDPTAAVNRFLTAVYTDQDVKAAANLVCREARDTEKLTEKINQVKRYASTYSGPRFTWTPVVADQNAERAVVSVKLTMTTEDEKSSEQHLTVTTIKKTGWWVCEVGS